MAEQPTNQLTDGPTNGPTGQPTNRRLLNGQAYRLIQRIQGGYQPTAEELELLGYWMAAHHQAIKEVSR